MPLRVFFFVLCGSSKSSSTCLPDIPVSRSTYSIDKFCPQFATHHAQQ